MKIDAATEKMLKAAWNSGFIFLWNDSKHHGKPTLDETKKAMEKFLSTLEAETPCPHCGGKGHVGHGGVCKKSTKTYPATPIGVGSFVVAKDGCVLACGSGIYSGAVCVESFPAFVLVSLGCDMIWEGETIGDFYTRETVSDAVLEVCKDCLVKRRTRAPSETKSETPDTAYHSRSDAKRQEAGETPASVQAIQYIKNHDGTSGKSMVRDPLCRSESVQPTVGAAIYPCQVCGLMRTKAEGGTTFAVCDECWHQKFSSVQPGELAMRIAEEVEHHFIVTEKKPSVPSCPSTESIASIIAPHLAATTPPSHHISIPIAG